MYSLKLSLDLLNGSTAFHNLLNGGGCTHLFHPNLPFKDNLVLGLGRRGDGYVPLQINQLVGTSDYRILSSAELALTDYFTLTPNQLNSALIGNTDLSDTLVNPTSVLNLASQER
jgi:hypothetical protein